jgi:ACS family hexuronate transporter-like MFS transporter
MIPPRWRVMFVFVLASALSYLDRQILSALAPTIKAEYGLDDLQFGWVVSTFSFVYALSAPLAGLFIDRAGLTIGICTSIGFWSMAGVATGFTTGLNSLLACRAWLGLAESGNFPASAKTIALYLEPRERALGSGVGQLGISLGMVCSPLLATYLASLYGWRAAFMVAGALGFLWIPCWLAATRSVPTNALSPAPGSSWDLVRDRRLWGLVAANMLAMTTYSLWSNWTTIFFVNTYGLTQNEANYRVAWIPPIFAALGGLTGGALSLRFQRRGLALIDARFRASLIGSSALLVTALTPHLPNSFLAALAIGWSFFWTVAYSANLYALPIDYFGPERAGQAVAALTMGFGVLQTVISPWIGAIVKTSGFGPVCLIIAVMPLVSYQILRLTRRPA